MDRRGKRGRKEREEGEGGREKEKVTFPPTYFINYLEVQTYGDHGVHRSDLPLPLYSATFRFYLSITRKSNFFFQDIFFEEVFFGAVGALSIR